MWSIISDTLKKEGYKYITELEETREYFRTINLDDPFVKECKKIYLKYLFKKISLTFDDPLISATGNTKNWKKEYEKFCKKKELVEKSTIDDKGYFEKAIDIERDTLIFNAPNFPPDLLSVDDMAKIFEALDGELEMEFNEDLYFGKDYLKKYELYKCMLD